MALLRSASRHLAGLDDALGVAQQLIDSDQRALARRPQGAEVSCRAGCTACCHQAVPVGPAELRAIVAAIAALPADHQERIATQILEAERRLRPAGFTAESIHETSSDDEQFEVAKRYFAEYVPCPLLEDGVCSVRAARPLACREYLVVSDPQSCGSIGGDNNIVRIRSKRKVLKKFANLERRHGDRTSYVLALALSERIPEARPQPLDAAAVFDELISVT